MLTWAAAWLMVKIHGENGLWLIIGMGCDVTIVYWIAQAVIVISLRR